MQRVYVDWFPVHGSSRRHGKKLQVSLRKEHARATALVAGQVIHGQGGIGKTRLAVEFGLAHAEQYTALFSSGRFTAIVGSHLANWQDRLFSISCLRMPRRCQTRCGGAMAQNPLRLLPNLDNVDMKRRRKAVEEKLALLSTGHVGDHQPDHAMVRKCRATVLDVLSEDSAIAPCTRDPAT